MTPNDINETLILEPDPHEPGQLDAGEQLGAGEQLDADASIKPGALPPPVSAERPAAQPLWGVYPGVVVDPQDKNGQGRMLVELPWAYDAQHGPLRVWARLVAPLTGNGTGTWLPPEADTEVLVAFAHGDARYPYIVGALWNGRDLPPSPASSDERLIRTPGGLTIRFDESDSQPQLRLETPGGQALVLNDNGSRIHLETSTGSTIELAPTGIKLTSPGEVSVQAAVVKIDASLVTIDSGMVRVSGVVQADTVITNSVVASSYTPGAGNIW
ncbi:MAG: phage baseplate assembly protein V [Anaerolineales bacterium]|jgi:uncharacterized protein involved in type VI secretion and phage assembly